MIPKVVHVSWKSKNVVSSNFEIIKQGLRKLIELNPDWRVEVSTDEEVDAYLREHLKEDYNLVKDVGIVAKTDIWRLIKLFNEGGVYTDIDRLWNVKLSDLIDDSIKWVLPTCADVDFSHDLMITAPNNPAYANTINLYLQRRREGSNNIYFLGAQTYMHAVSHTLLGEMINTDPGPEVFKRIRDKIEQFPFIKTYKETHPYDTICYKGDVSMQAWEAMKRKFYANSGVKHWTGEW
jgi:mannosyltransferase OCH1-like enzyme